MSHAQTDYLIIVDTLAFDIVQCKKTYYSITTHLFNDKSYCTNIIWYSGKYPAREQILNQESFRAKNEYTAFDMHARVCAKATDFVPIMTAALNEIKCANKVSQKEKKEKEKEKENEKETPPENEKDTIYENNDKTYQQLENLINDTKPQQKFNTIYFDTDRTAANKKRVTVMTTQWSENYFDTRIHNLVINTYTTRKQAELGHAVYGGIMTLFAVDLHRFLLDKALWRLSDERWEQDFVNRLHVEFEKEKKKKAQNPVGKILYPPPRLIHGKYHEVD